MQSVMIFVMRLPAGWLLHVAAALSVFLDWLLQQHLNAGLCTAATLWCWDLDRPAGCILPPNTVQAVSVLVSFRHNSLHIHTPAMLAVRNSIAAQVAHHHRAT